MNIVFDIDDTIMDETGFMLKYAPKYLKKKYHIDAVVKNPNGYNIVEVFGLKEFFEQNGNLTQEDIEKQCTKTTNDFWNTYYLKYTFYPAKKGIKEIIHKLKSEGHNIYLLSTRGKKTQENDSKMNEFIRLKIVPLLTKIQLRVNGISYDDYNQLKLVQNEEEKIEFINKIKAKFVFDDQTSLLRRIPEYSIPLCVKTPHTKTEEITSRMKVIFSFENDDIYSIISDNSHKRKNNNKKRLNITFYERIFTENFYILVRNLGKNTFLNKFQPIVHGVEQIPKDKRAVIYIGNHRNNFDPLIATLFIEHPVHWAALLRLFEAKENLFGRDDIYILRELSALLIKSMGSIPIARSTDDNYRKINLQSLIKIDEYIKMGSSIGFYPEGTINRRPDEVNILPLASDAIFSIAQRNSSWVQPFSIVWTPSDVNIENKVVIAFSEPIETTEITPQEVKNLWSQSLNNSIENTKILFDQIREVENSNYENKELEKKLVIKKFINEGKSI